LISPGALAKRLGSLEVEVDRIECLQRAVAVPSYTWGPRPLGFVCACGGGEVGVGEVVAFTEAEQAAAAASIVELELSGRIKASVVREKGLHAYAACALEAALIDLGLRQAGLTMASLLGITEAALSWVVSFDADSDPATRGEVLSDRFGGAALKVDVDPSWDDDTWRALSALNVAVLDFKQAGDRAAVERARAHLRDVVIEDPPSEVAPSELGPIAFDRTIVTAADAAKASAGGAWVNIKGPRMGGFITALEALDVVERSRAYFGGMFELGAGRVQARLLAAAFLPEQPNDLAPIPLDDNARDAPGTIVRFDGLGFGGGLAR